VPPTEEALDPRFRQDTLKSYLTKNATEEQTPESRKGRPKLAYRFTFGDKVGKTLHDVQRTDTDISAGCSGQKIALRMMRVRSAGTLMLTGACSSNVSVCAWSMLGSESFESTLGKVNTRRP
jgi:hypothetical protein